MKREMNLNQPIWDGDRSNPKVGIAHFRLLNKKEEVAKGNAKIRIFINFKETDHKSPVGWKLLYPFPFDMKCTEVAKYPTMVLNDFRRTVVHVVPLAHMEEVKHYRSGSPRGRTMPQEEFRKLTEMALAIKKLENEEKMNANRTEN